MQIKTFSCKYGYLGRIRPETEAIHNLEMAYLNINKQIRFLSMCSCEKRDLRVIFSCFPFSCSCFKTLKALLATMPSTKTTNKKKLPASNIFVNVALKHFLFVVALDGIVAKSAFYVIFTHLL